jgi:hypothetical protein
MHTLKDKTPEESPAIDGRENSPEESLLNLPAVALLLDVLPNDTSQNTSNGVPHGTGIMSYVLTAYSAVILLNIGFQSHCDNCSI